MTAVMLIWYRQEYRKSESEGGLRGRRGYSDLSQGSTGVACCGDDHDDDEEEDGPLTDAKASLLGSGAALPPRAHTVLV